MKLVIIEAVGKIPLVTRLSKAKWGPEVKVLATGGYLKMLPNDRIGIDSSTFKPNADVETLHGQVFQQELMKLTRQWRHQQGDLRGLDIVVMTDPDREGEGIAHQVYEVLDRYTPGVPRRRMLTNELSAEGFRTASVEDTPHKGIQAAFDARRALDRLLPFAASLTLRGDNQFFGMGRVQTAALRVVGDKAKQWRRFLCSGWVHTGEGDFFVHEYDTTRENSERKRQSAFALSQVKKLDTTHQTLTIAPPPPHSGQSLLATMLDIRPEKTMQWMQKSYMEGRISYPRTDQTELGLHGRSIVAAMAENLHLGARLRPQWYAQAQEEQSRHTDAFWIQGAHPALHPTFSWGPSTSSSPSEQERVEAEIAVRAMANVMSDAVVERESVWLMTEADSQGQNHWFQAVKDTVVEPGWMLAYERIGRPNPLRLEKGLRKHPLKIVEQYPTLGHVIEWLNDEHMGRPSTIAYVPNTLQSLGLLSAACIPTREADSQLRGLEKSMRAYTYASFTQVMEQGLSHLVDSPDDYYDVIRSLLVQAGVDVVSMVGKLEENQLMAASMDMETQSQELLMGEPFS